MSLIYLISFNSLNNMKPLPFSLHNSVLKQVVKEDVIAWSKSDSYMPPVPKYEKKVIKLTVASAYAFSRNFILSLRP